MGRSQGIRMSNHYVVDLKLVMILYVNYKNPTYIKMGGGVVKGRYSLTRKRHESISWWTGIRGSSPSLQSTLNKGMIWGKNRLRLDICSGEAQALGWVPV